MKCLARFFLSFLVEIQKKNNVLHHMWEGKIKYAGMKYGGRVGEREIREYVDEMIRGRAEGKGVMEDGRRKDGGAKVKTKADIERVFHD